MANYFSNAAIPVTHPAGRLRIAVPALYCSDTEKRRIETALSAHEHVDAVYANPLTGKVLILFNVAIPPDVVLIALGLPLSDEPHTNDSAIKQAPPLRTRRKKTRPDKAVADREIYPPWHLREADTALAFHGSSRQSGLASSQAEERLRQGENILPQAQGRSSLDILPGQFKSLPVLLLGVSAALSVVTGGISEGVAIVAVLALNGGIGYATERSAESTIVSLSELVDDIVPVIRDGKFQQVQASRLVA
jgi:Ca2+-transporting ATPase